MCFGLEGMQYRSPAEGETVVSNACSSSAGPGSDSTTEMAPVYTY